MQIISYFVNNNKIKLSVYCAKTYVKCVSCLEYIDWTYYKNCDGSAYWGNTGCHLCIDFPMNGYIICRNCINEKNYYCTECCKCCCALHKNDNGICFNCIPEYFQEK